MEEMIEKWWLRNSSDFDKSITHVMFDTFITILTISQLFPPLVQHMDEFDQGFNVNIHWFIFKYEINPEYEINCEKYWKKNIAVQIVRKI